jgi:hypothetical protein
VGEEQSGSGDPGTEGAGATPAAQRGDPAAASSGGANPPAGDQLGDAGKRAIQAERDAREAAEKALTDATAKLKELEDRDKSEAERQADRVAELERKLADADTRMAGLVLERYVEEAAKAAGAHDASVVARLIDTASVKYDKAGVPTNTEELIKGVQDKHPFLFTSNGGYGSGDGGNRGAEGGGSEDMTAKIRRAAGRA